MSLPKCGPEEAQKLMRGKNSIVRHLKWNLVTTQSHQPSITPLQLDPQNNQKYHVLFLLISGMKCSGRNPQCSEIFSLQFSVFTQSSLPVSE